MSAGTLKEKMKDFEAGNTKSIQVSASDLAGGSGTDETKRGPTRGTVEADVPQEAKDDVFATADKTGELHKGMLPSFLVEKVDITEEDREAFISALVSGGRYERPFSLFGGKLCGVFRCRSGAESDGILAWLGKLLNDKQLEVRIEYMSMMRNALLACQVKCLRGIISEDFDELQRPYGPTRVAVDRTGEDGKTVHDTELREPGWVGAAEAWGKRPEALVTAVHNELQLFERRYWAMVNEARNQNFWNPAASI